MWIRTDERLISVDGQHIVISKSKDFITIGNHNIWLGEETWAALDRIHEWLDLSDIHPAGQVLDLRKEVKDEDS